LEKNWRIPHPATIPNPLTDQVENLKASLRPRDPALVAAQSDASHVAINPGNDALQIPLLGNMSIVSWPELMGYGTQGTPLPDFQLALLLYYLMTSDGTALSENWVSFAELPGGRIYNAAFQGYSGDLLAKSVGLELDSFRAACTLAGGRPLGVGSCSFTFRALPRLPLMVTYWLGDEDFPSSCKILFDESACHYLPIDACAILGSMLTRRLLNIHRTNS
jgi:hypothetical protein